MGKSTSCFHFVLKLKQYDAPLHLLGATKLLLIVVLLAITPYLVAAENSDTDHVPGEVLVGFSKEATVPEIEAFERTYGLALIKEFARIRMRHYKLAEGITVAEAIEILSGVSIIQYVEPNFRITPLSLPTDPMFPKQWALHNIGQQVNNHSGNEDIDIDWPEAMEIYTGTKDIIVAVVDSGIQGFHQDLSANMWINLNEISGDGIDNDNNGYIDDRLGWNFVDNNGLPLDARGHGTLVAGLIGSVANNEVGSVGVTPNVKIMALRIESDITKIIDAFEYAAMMGAQIINASFHHPFSTPMRNTIENLNLQGVLLVAAAGNDGKSNDNDLKPNYPASYSVENIISVAATNRSDDLAFFSNFGEISVDIAAPGTDIVGPNVTRYEFYSLDFEAGLGGWISGHEPGANSSWNWALFLDDFGNIWLTDSGGILSPIFNYSSSTNSWIKSPPFNAKPIGTQLEFFVWHDLEFFWDRLYVEVSTDGINWDKVKTMTGKSSIFCPYCFPIPIRGAKKTVDLSAYDNELIEIRFRLTSNFSSNSDGAYIDNISLTFIDPINFTGNNYDDGQDGTSFSAPLVSGVAALIMVG